MKDYADSVIASIVASAIWSALGLLRRRLGHSIQRTNPRKTWMIFYAEGLAWVVISLAAFALQHYNILNTCAVVIVLQINSMCLFGFSYLRLRQFWAVGLEGADVTIKKGIGYKQSLGLVHNELSFLGTGASKLTSLNPEFEEALNRCRSDKPIRFILLKPNHDNLVIAAARAVVPPNTYEKKLLNSLRIIASLREDRQWNIEVRFLPKTKAVIPIFRLMFIDSSLCLMSYNAFGEGDPSEFPQLRLVAASNDKTANKSFYYALEQYYEALWKDSEPWDFKEFISA